LNRLLLFFLVHCAWLDHCSVMQPAHAVCSLYFLSRLRDNSWLAGCSFLPKYHEHIDVDHAHFKKSCLFHASQCHIMFF
jgi:hypothetical protein